MKKQTGAGSNSLLSADERSRLSPFGLDIAEGLENAIRYVRGERALVLKTIVSAAEPPPVVPPKKVAALRHKLGMTQWQFARLINVNVKSVEGWEQGKRKPGGPSRRLLQLLGNERIISVIADKA